MISIFSLFECITCFSLSLEDANLIANVKWIFHVSDFLRLFKISVKYS